MQLAATLSVPSSNHLIPTLPGAKEVFLTLVKGLIQSSLSRAASPQNPSGSVTERSYISRYCASVTSAFACTSADGG